LGHLDKWLAMMPLDRPFLASEIMGDIPSSMLMRLERLQFLRKAGRGGYQNRYWIWQVTDRAKTLMESTDQQLWRLFNVWMGGSRVQRKRGYAGL